jgi:hypothetical protein
MNCTRVQELLPLYVGADLAAREAEAVRAHLEACALCRDVVEEFAASAAWLQAAPPPEFDEAFFDDLRAGVWQRQAQLAAQPTWFERWLPSGGWRPVWAATALAVLVMSAIWSWSVYRRGAAPMPNRIDDYAGTTTDKGPTAPTPQDNLPELKPRSTNVSAQQKRRKPQAVAVAPRLPEIVVPLTPRLPVEPGRITQSTRDAGDVAH